MCCPPSKEEPPSHHASSSMKKNSTRNCGKRHVSFDSHVQVMTLAPRSSCIKEKKRLYYQKSELREFKTSTTVLCRQLRCYRKLEEGDCLRGLERRISFARQRLKNGVLRDVLNAQDEGRSPRYIATIARENSEWATELAIETGTSDYYTAHHPHLLEQDENDLLESILQEEENCHDDDDSSDEEEDFPTYQPPSPCRKRRHHPCEEPPARRRKSHPMKSISPPTVGGGRRTRVPMWQPESWVTAR